MAFDPIQEDCHRLVLEALRRDNIPLTDGAAVERLMEQFTRNPAPLIVHDRDRAGHLIAKVVEAVDYRIPFIPDDAQAEQEEAAAENMLREAAALDPANWDAQRMLTALTAESNEEYVQYLVSKCDEVEHDLALKIASAQDPYEREAAGDLTRRPYLRWLAALASRALISGRYRMSLEAANRSLDFAPNDPAGVRHTAMLAMAKLEYPAEELKRFRSAHSVPYLANTPLRRRPKDAERDLDPWTLIALMSAAWRELDYEGAEHYLRILARSCPHAAEALYFQTEFPDGVYARVNVGAGSTDELVLPGARLRCVAPRAHRCSTRACP
jgi:tetratricopeptide (TPR) repeat protein